LANLGGKSPSYLKTSLYAVATTTLLLCSSQNYAQQYYKWIDANGSTHYTTTPPPKGAKRLDRISTYGTSTQNTNPPKAQQPQNESQPSSETQSPQSFGQPSTNVASQTPATTAPVQTQTTAPVRVKPNL
jgi:hypothetical protein